MEIYGINKFLSNYLSAVFVQSSFMFSSIVCFQICYLFKFQVDSIASKGLLNGSYRNDSESLYVFLRKMRDSNPRNLKKVQRISSPPRSFTLAIFLYDKVNAYFASVLFDISFFYKKRVEDDLLNSSTLLPLYF